MEVVLARAGYSASRRCFRIMLRRDHETANQPRCGSPAAAIYLAEGSPERAIELLAPVAERSDESLIPTWAAITPCSSTPPVREIGDSREAEAALERALDLAEPEGLILPLTIIPVHGVLERHPRHRDRARHVPVNNPRRAANTIRTHLRDIDPKLGVHGRAEAVARARESSGSSHHPTGARQR